MFIGVGNPIPRIANLPGASRPGGGGGGGGGLAQVDNLYSFEFDGTESYIKVDYNSIFDFGSTYSFSFWVNNAVLSTVGVKGIITCDSSSGAVGPRGWLIFQFGQELRIACPFTGNQIDVANFFTTNNTWIHVGVTYDGTTFNVYKDGSIFDPTTTGLMALNANSQDLIIGNSAYGAGRFFEGKLDEVAMFNTTLGATDIANIYNATTTGKTADLSALSTPPVAWYRMGD